MMKKRFLKTQDELPHEKTNNFAYFKKKLRRRSFCGNRKADQSLGIHYRDSKIPLLINLKKVILLSVFCGCASPVCVGPGRDPRLLVLTREGSYVAYFSPLYGIYLHLFCRLTIVVCWIFLC